MEAMPWTVIGGLTPSALLSIVVVLILTGHLVPRSTYRELHDQKKHWRDAAEKLRETNHVLTKTVEKQEVTSDTIIRVMGSVQDANHQDGGEK